MLRVRVACRIPPAPKNRSDLKQAWLKTWKRLPQKPSVTHADWPRARPETASPMPSQTIPMFSTLE